MKIGEPITKTLLYTVALIILIIEWYKGGIQSVIILGVMYIFGFFISSLLKK